MVLKLKEEHGTEGDCQNDEAIDTSWFCVSVMGHMKFDIGILITCYLNGE